MGLQLLKGGKGDNDLSREDRVEKINLLKQHMRDIESNMALINQESKRIKWDELTLLSNVCYETIVSILALIKNEEKSKIKEVVNNTRSNLKVVNKELDEDTITEFIGE